MIVRGHVLFAKTRRGFSWYCLSVLLMVVIGVCLVVTVMGSVVVLGIRRQRVDTNAALILSGLRRRSVRFESTWVARWIHVETLDLRTHTVEVVHARERGITCSDGALVQLRATLTVAVERDEQSIIKAAQVLGCPGIADGTAVETVVAPKLSTALIVLCARFSAADVMQKLPLISDEALDYMGRDLNGLRISAITVSPIVDDPAGLSVGPFR